MDALSLGFSPCPNDTFIFYGLIHARVPTSGLAFRERLEDVETLNGLALAGALDICKVSYHALGYLRDRYCLLRSGGALGRGCGPLVVTRGASTLADLRGKPVAVPGRFTTAALLLRLADPAIDTLVFMPFHEIMGAVARGEVAAGVIIHESRFTYRDHGLTKLMDLGVVGEGNRLSHPPGRDRCPARPGRGDHHRRGAGAAVERGVCPGEPRRGEGLHSRPFPGDERRSLHCPHRPLRE